MSIAQAELAFGCVFLLPAIAGLAIIWQAKGQLSGRALLVPIGAWFYATVLGLTLFGDSFE